VSSVSVKFAVGLRTCVLTAPAGGGEVETLWIPSAPVARPDESELQQLSAGREALAARRIAEA
jgi:hypothetical protein